MRQFVSRKALWTTHLVLVAAAACSRDRVQSPTPPPIVDLDTVQVFHSEKLWQVQAIQIHGDQIAVLNGGTREVLLFDPEGRLISSFGRRGQGPGEFGFVRDLVLRGDTAYVLDSLWKRISRFVMGELDADWSLAAVTGDPVRLSVLDEGKLIVVTAVRPPEVESASESAAIFYRYINRVVGLFSRAQPDWLELFTMPGVEASMQHLPNGSTYHLLPAFRTDLSYDFASDGVIGVDHRSGWIGWWSWSGDSSTIYDGPAEQPFVPDEELRRWEDSRRQRADRLAMTGGDPELFLRTGRAAIDRWRGRVPRPVFEDLKTDGEKIAVQQYHPGDHHVGSWLVLDRSGNIRARWRVPMNVRLMTLHGDRIAAVARDSLDTESILILRSHEFEHP